MSKRRPFEKHEKLVAKINNWFGYRDRVPFYAKLEEWLEQFPEDMKGPMLRLLENFNYYNSNNIGISVVKLFTLFSKNCVVDDFYYVGIEKEFDSGFSQVFFTSFWSTNELKDSVIIGIRDLLFANKCLTKNLAIVDDYIGSAETMIAFIEELISINNNFAKTEIVILALHISMTGKTTLEKFARTTGLVIKVIALESSDKAFTSDLIFSRTENSQIKDRYLKFCESMNMPQPLGYSEIEALVSFHYNTPNNTLPVFWRNMIDFIALFKRHDKKKNFLDEMKSKAKKNKVAQRTISPPKIDESYRFQLFTLYCVVQGSKIDFQECKSEFGLTDKQLNEMLKLAVEGNYLLYDVKSKSYKLTSHYPKAMMDLFKQTIVTDSTDAKIELKETSYIPKDFNERFGGYKNQKKEGI